MFGEKMKDWDEEVVELGLVGSAVAHSFGACIRVSKPLDRCICICGAVNCQHYE